MGVAAVFRHNFTELPPLSEAGRAGRKLPPAYHIVFTIAIPIFKSCKGNVKLNRRTKP